MYPNLNAEMARLNLTLEDLAKVIDCSVSTMSMTKNFSGKRRPGNGCLSCAKGWIQAERHYRSCGQSFRREYLLRSSKEHQ